METALIVIAIVLGLAFVVILASRIGKFIAHNEQRAYVMRVLHNVEARGEFDYYERNM